MVGLTSRISCSGCRLDLPRQRRPEMMALNSGQARPVLGAARGDELEALWMVALTTGLSQGDLLALRWPDVDLDRGSLRVVASLIRVVGQVPQTRRAEVASLPTSGGALGGRGGRAATAPRQHSLHRIRLCSA